MASTDFLCAFAARQNHYIGANPATPDYDGDIPVLDFDSGTDEFAECLLWLPAHYGGGGLTTRWMWSADTATSGVCVWGIAIAAIEDGVNDGNDGFAAYQQANFTAPGTAGIVNYGTILLTSGAQMDSWVAGQWAKARITRDANHASDTMTGDAQFIGLVINET